MLSKNGKPYVPSRYHWENLTFFVQERHCATWLKEFKVGGRPVWGANRLPVFVFVGAKASGHKHRPKKTNPSRNQLLVHVDALKKPLESSFRGTKNGAGS